MARTVLRTLLIGLGRAGAGLHLPVLTRARAAHPELFADRPVVGLDPGSRPSTATDGLVIADSLHHARRHLDPAGTVVHLCTPPQVRGALLEEAASLGYRRFIVEKPLAADRTALSHVLDAVDRHGLHVHVVSPWLHSALTERLAALIGEVGDIRSITVTQDKPRFRRSLTSGSHTNAFEVEVPHALGVLLRLLGDAEVRTASCTDLRWGDEIVRHMGGATLTLRHRDGVRSRIRCDLTSPVRRRRITIETTTGARLVGHYPVAQDDDVAQLDLWRGGRRVRERLHDDALHRCLTHAYRRFAGGAPGAAAEATEGLRLHARTVELLDDAKRLAIEDPPEGAPSPVSRRRGAARHAG
ncbi:hypothetical protein [Streptomyces alanosinicus]|uniref:Uncharacterized protein n=1 Tax=Streptomyces alanosinicus TaxID=68171 RepID=A0A919D5U9_9ACTN|nr:hypothetical protein [Streptomyces alanosinicus]GHE09526.1 hypothetical protein GCM10010339_62100 [Streptomyces alanosinicus]